MNRLKIEFALEDATVSLLIKRRNELWELENRAEDEDFDLLAALFLNRLSRIVGLVNFLAMICYFLNELRVIIKTNYKDLRDFEFVGRPVFSLKPLFQLAALLSEFVFLGK